MNVQTTPHVTQEQLQSANHLAVRLGYWSALGMLVAFAIFTMAFIAIPLTGSLFIWTNLADYLAYVRSGHTFFQDLARWMMLLFGPLTIILFAAIDELTVGARKLLARIGFAFVLAFAALTGANYFIQLTAVRLAIQKDTMAGLEQIVQANPISAVAALNVLGWSLFFGLASLFVAPLFRSRGVPRFVGVCFWLNGAMCLLGGLGYVLDNPIVVFVTLNFGMGGAVIGFTTGLAILFRRARLAANFNLH
jgi:hypothetical protein